jgi:hypothetical protein
VLSGSKGARAAAAGLVAVLAIAAAFVWRTPVDRTLYPPRPGEPALTVYVVNNGYHTDLVLPREALATRRGPAAAALSLVSPGPFVALGWGDRRFYIEHGVSPRRALDGLRALFWPANASAVKLAPLARSPDRIWRDGVTPLRISARGFEHMAARLDRTFELERGAPVVLPEPSEDGGRFFASRERFGALHLCNHWTAQLLNAAGLSTRPLLDVLPAGLIFDLEADGALVHGQSRQGAS